MSTSRARTVLREEINGVRPVLALAIVATHVLPHLVGNRLRTAVLRLAGVRIGAGTVIGGGIRIVGTGRCQQRITIGRRSWINAGCYFDATEQITIGDDVAIAQQVLVLTQTHDLADSSRRAGPLRAEPVTISDGCWIGARAVILPGVTVGRGAVVAAGAVVVNDVEPDSMVGGVPARCLRSLTDGEPLQGP